MNMANEGELPLQKRLRPGSYKLRNEIQFRQELQINKTGLKALLSSTPFIYMDEIKATKRAKGEARKQFCTMNGFNKATLRQLESKDRKYDRVALPVRAALSARVELPARAELPGTANNDNNIRNWYYLPRRRRVTLQHEENVQLLNNLAGPTMEYVSAAPASTATTSTASSASNGRDNMSASPMMVNSQGNTAVASTSTQPQDVSKVSQEN